MMANGLDVNEIASITSAVFLIVFGVVNAAAAQCGRRQAARARSAWRAPSDASAPRRAPLDTAGSGHSPSWCWWSRRSARSWWRPFGCATLAPPSLDAQG
ncbi:MAG: hypothetical protein R2716_13645 [Microthrixaceae bacterium]